MAIIGRVATTGESADEAIIERGAHLLASGRKFGIEAFALFAMHLDPESPHAQAYHAYAHAQYNTQDWTLIGQMAREGTQLRDIGQQVTQVCNGGTLVPVSHYQRFLDEFCPAHETGPSDRLKDAMAKLGAKG